MMKSQYVVYDGLQERPFKKDEWHDCMVTHDMKYISITSYWRNLCKAGYDPVLLFSCEPGRDANEINIKGKSGGAFTTFACDVLRNNPKSTYREIVACVNHHMQANGIDQRCEVVCRKALLDMPYLSSDFTIIFDACRRRIILMKDEVCQVSVPMATEKQKQHRRIARLCGKSDQKLFHFSGHGIRAKLSSIKGEKASLTCHRRV